MLAHRHPGEFERSSRLHEDCPSCVRVVRLADLTRPTEFGGASASLPGDAVARCVVRVMVACISDVSRVISTPRVTVPASLHLEALQLKPS